MTPWFLAIPLVLHVSPDVPETSPTEVAISREELEAIPGILGGPLSVAPFLPGTRPVLSPLSVVGARGKQPSTIGVFYDGVRLPTAFHLLAGPSAVQDASVDGVRFERGTPEPDQGRALGGAFSLEPSLPPGPGVHAEASLDLLRAGAITHYGSASEETRISVGASAAWTPWLYSQIASGLQADLVDYLVRAEQRVGEGTVRLLAIGSADTVGMSSATDLLGAAVTFHRVDLRGRRAVAGGEGELGFTFGWDRLRAELGGPVAQSTASVSELGFGARAAWERPLGASMRLRVGTDVERRAASLTQRWTVRAPEVEGATGEAPPIVAGVSHPIADAVIGGAYVQVGSSAGGPWQWSAGVRVDDYHLFGGENLVVVEPQARVSRSLGDRMSVHGGVGLLHQMPTFLLPLPGVELASLRWGLQEVLRINAGATFEPWEGTTAQLDLFVDPMLRAIELSPLDRDFLQAVKAAPEDVQATRGSAHGVELFVRRRFESGWFGWFTYSWQQSRRDLTYALRNDYGEPVGTAQASLPVGWEQAHAASLVGGRRIGGWMISAAAQFHTGAPEVGGLSSTTQREGLDRLQEGTRWIEADRIDADRLPPFFRMDVRVARDFTLGSVDLTATLDVQNVTLSPELTKYNYASTEAGLTRTVGGSGVPALPLPMLGLRGRL